MNGQTLANNLDAQQLGDRQVPVQEDFYLLDVIGGACSVVMHPTKPIVAYTSGCMTIVHDMMSDSKINLCQHTHEVFALAFSPPGAGNSPSGGDFLISIDLNRNDMNDTAVASTSTMCLWNWSKGICLQEVAIPKSQNNTFIGSAQNANMLQRSITITFEKVGGLFFVMESGSPEMGGGYRVSLWILNRNQKFEMITVNDLELQSACIGVCIMPKNNMSSDSHLTAKSTFSRRDTVETTLRFLTLEKTCIKIWEANSVNADLLKRIHVKQSMKQCVASELTGFLFILGDNGKLLILDQEGEFVSTISKDLVFFTTIGLAQDKLLLGTDRGTIYVYHMASLQFINEIPYQLGILNNFNLNSATKTDKRLNDASSVKKFNPLLTNTDEDQLDHNSLFKIGPPVSSISITSNQRFLLIKYTDSSFVTIDRTVQNPHQAILGYSYGHFEQITGMQWMNQKSKRRPIDQWQVQNSSNACFVTCSSDMGVFIWRHFGDRWSFSYIDVVKCFDQSLSFQRKYCDKSTQDIKLSTVSLYPKSSQLVVGDNRGIVRVFQFTQDSAYLVHQYKLQKPSDAYQQDGIKQIILTKDEQYAIIAFDSGLVCAYEIKNSFTLLGILEKDAQRFTHHKMLDTQVRIIEDRQRNDNMAITNEFNFNSSFDSLDTKYGSKPYMNQFRLVSSQTPNSIRLQQVEVKGNKLIKTPLVQYVIDEGKIAGFDVHPSNDYLLVTSTKGRIYVYRIDTGELRGTIKIPYHAKGCCIDPSGLYVLVTVPSFNSKVAQNLQMNEMDPTDVEFGSLGQSQSDIARTTVLMFEIGTGFAAAEIKSLFEISQVSFSPDAKFISVGSTKGAVCVWALGDHLYQNIKQIIDSMQLQSDFWSNYPIFLPDYGTYGMEMTPVKQVLDTQRDFLNNEPDLMGEIDQQQFNSPQRSQQRQEFASQRQIPSYQANRDMQSALSSNYFQSQRPKTLIDQNHQVQSQLSNDQYKQQQDKFISKTFVEDQQTQITPHTVLQQPHPVKDFTQRKPQNNIIDRNYSQSFGQKVRNVNEGVQAQLPEIPNYIASQRSLQSGYQGIQSHHSRTSLASHMQSPNKAEQLYQGAYNIDRNSVGQNPGSIRQQNPSPYQARPYQQNYRPYEENVDVNYQPITREPRQDFIDRTEQQRRPLIQVQNYADPPDIDQIPYVENQDGAQLYQKHLGLPRDNGVIKTATLCNTQASGMPISSIGVSPKGVSQQIRGRFQGNKNPNPDPIDIDDDVSDDEPMNAQEQLHMLDGMSKYMQNIRVPTKFVGDDYMERNGKDAEKAYTLHRLREEERILGSERERQDLNLSQSSSTYEVVEEMYDQMNSFEDRLKYNTRQQPPLQPQYY